VPEYGSIRPTFSGAPWAIAGVGNRKAEAAVSRLAEPRLADPRLAYPRLTDPRLTDPRLADPIRKLRRFSELCDEVECDLTIPPAVG
jgi:hypothetical protein